MPKCGRISTNKKLKSAFIKLLEERNVPVSEAMLKDIPRRWEMFEDFVIFPASAFNSDLCASLGQELWIKVAEIFKVSRIARHSTIKNDDFRSPQLEMLLGTESWVRKVENGIIYELDVARTMFSSGNVTEKIRMGRLSCRGEIVVDLFAGIGYFTLPILHAGAEKVYACEWSPSALIALRRNCELNRVGNRCEILFGDNRKIAPVGLADRVLLGLIPSSEPFWTTACRCLKPDFGGTLHVHMNVSTMKKDSALCVSVDSSPDLAFKKSAFKMESSRITERLSKICELLHGCPWSATLLHVECVKSYGPCIYHCVFDICLKPVKS